MSHDPLRSSLFYSSTEPCFTELCGGSSTTALAQTGIHLGGYSGIRMAGERSRTGHRYARLERDRNERMPQVRTLLDLISSVRPE
jgi:hypothetical protein